MLAWHDDYPANSRVYSFPCSGRKKFEGFIEYYIEAFIQATKITLENTPVRNGHAQSVSKQFLNGLEGGVPRLALHARWTEIR